MLEEKYKFYYYINNIWHIISLCCAIARLVGAPLVFLNSYLLLKSLKL